MNLFELAILALCLAVMLVLGYKLWRAGRPVTQQDIDDVFNQDWRRRR